MLPNDRYYHDMIKVSSAIAVVTANRQMHSILEQSSPLNANQINKLGLAFSNALDSWEKQYQKGKIPTSIEVLKIATLAAFLGNQYPVNLRYDPRGEVTLPVSNLTESYFVLEGYGFVSVEDLANSRSEWEKRIIQFYKIEPASVAISTYLKPEKPTSPTRIFVSHSSFDKEIGERIGEQFRRIGAKVWIDVQDMGHGDFISNINQALLDSDWLILILTTSALKSEAVQMEVNAAINLRLKHKLRGIIPIIVKPFEVELLPPLWASLQQYDGVSNLQSALNQIMKEIGLL